MNSGEDLKTVQDFWDKHDYKTEVFQDPTSQIAAMFGAQGVPTSIFIGKNGEAIFMAPGMLTEEQLVSAMDQIRKDFED